jgi:hypothetical protein
VAAVFFLTLAGALTLTGSVFLTSVAGVVLVAGVAPFLFPTEYKIDDWGLEARGLFRSRARPWSELRRLEVGPRAALVSPLARRSRLDRYRGIYLLFDEGDRDRVVAALRDRFEDREPAPEANEPA